MAVVRGVAEAFSRHHLLLPLPLLTYHQQVIFQSWLQFSAEANNVPQTDQSPAERPLQPLPDDGSSAPVEDRSGLAQFLGRKSLQKEPRKVENEQQRASLQPRPEKPIPASPPPLFFPRLLTRDKNEKAEVVAPLPLEEALELVKAHAKANFIETVEAAIQLSINPKRGDQMVRGAASLPHGSGKVVRVAVFARGAAAEEAKAAGADVVGAEELVEAVKKSGGKLDFDRCIATPQLMPTLSQVARILGPRGLMPNPKVGTVTNNVADAVREIKRGRVTFRADKQGIVHAGLGKVTLPIPALRENITAFTTALLLAKPAGLKGTSKYTGYIKGFSLSSTMGPGFKVDIKSL